MLPSRIFRYCLIVFLLIVGVVVSPVRTVFGDELEDKRKLVEELQAKLTEIQGQKQTLSQTISYLTTKVKLTESQIAQTEAEIQALEEEIVALGGKIETLNVSLDKLTQIYIERVRATYRNNSQQPLYLLLTSDRLNNFLKKYKYLQVSQRNDRSVMLELEGRRSELDAQKLAREVKQQEIEAAKKKLVAQKSALSIQKKEQQAALDLTKNNEKNYQAQLSRALAELEAIQSIIAGKGDETEVGKVNEGDRVASVISGASTCSNGAHLHFEVAKNNAHLNPANYLSSKDVIWDNSPDGSFGFSGSWRWPLDDPIRVTQGYGMTFYAATLRYYGGQPHTGIDMVNVGNYTVKAVKSGTLYRGSIGCRGGALRYVKVAHDEGISSYYLHVNY